jgi:DUF971 family protein
VADASANNWPTEIRVRSDGRTLALTFEDQTSFDVAAELLRVESPSAEVQGHAPEQKVLVSGKRNVRILAIEPVGNYAVKIIFDDGHDSGLFTWEYLLLLGRQGENLFDAYLQNLKEQGLSRDP